MERNEQVMHKTITQVLKFSSREEYEKALAAGYLDPTKDWSQERPDNAELVEVEGNILLNEGINNGIWPLVCGDSAATPFNNANARIGVGDGTDAESATQTGLTGTNQLYKGMDDGYPTYGTDQKATWQATFDETEANWTWNEWTIDNGAAGGVNLNRKVENLGTKTTGVWVLRVSITLS